MKITVPWDSTSTANFANTCVNYWRSIIQNNIWEPALGKHCRSLDDTLAIYETIIWFNIDEAVLSCDSFALICDNDTFLSSCSHIIYRIRINNAI